MKFDAKKLSRLDRAIVGGAGVAFIAGAAGDHPLDLAAELSAGVGGAALRDLHRADAGIVEVGASVVEMRASGEELPWAQKQPADAAPPQEQPASES